ncbi:MAG: hypothetical protein WBA17_05870 [Saprospiraceae bacterium]
MSEVKNAGTKGYAILFAIIGFFLFMLLLMYVYNYNFRFIPEVN